MLFTPKVAANLPPLKIDSKIVAFYMKPSAILARLKCCIIALEFDPGMYCTYRSKIIYVDYKGRVMFEIRLLTLQISPLVETGSFMKVPT